MVIDIVTFSNGVVIDKMRRYLGLSLLATLVDICNWLLFSNMDVDLCICLFIKVWIWPFSNMLVDIFYVILI